MSASRSRWRSVTFCGRFERFSGSLTFLSAASSALVPATGRVPTTGFGGIGTMGVRFSFPAAGVEKPLEPTAPRFGVATLHGAFGSFRSLSSLTEARGGADFPLVAAGGGSGSMLDVGGIEYEGDFSITFLGGLCVLGPLYTPYGGAVTSLGARGNGSSERGDFALGDFALGDFALGDFALGDSGDTCGSTDFESGVALETDSTRLDGFAGRSVRL